MTAALHTVRVTDSWGQSNTLVTWQKDPAALMALTGFELLEGDRYYFADNGNSTLSLNIQRAFPVQVKADGMTLEARLCSGTVEEVLAQCGVALGEHDYTQPSLNTQVDEDTAITVHRVEYRDTITTEPIPYETEYVYSSLFHRFKSRTMTMQEGEDGIREFTHRERVVDGDVESSQIVKVEDTLAPKSEIIKAYGERAPVSALSGPEVVNGKPVSYTAVYTGRATGYSAKRGRGSSGLGLHYGTVAVNPNLIPYGTKLYIESTDGKFVYGYAIATDTGTALMDGRVLVDLFYETYDESVMNGAKIVNVYVVG
ncbi:MAG: G5 domain-containing protein [Oscillospiraceae bacterium]|nr:G5 domain-containing protein [Oscillospiraceae bacterium]